MAESHLLPPSEQRASDPLCGEVLGGRFELLEQLDEGGMAVVYIGLDRLSGEHVAVKVLRDGLATSDEIRTRFFHEAQAMMGMVSRHIVEVLDVGAFDDRHAYFAMELLDGLRLDELCGEALPVELVYDYARQMVAALEVAHANGVVHRDLKPDNIFLETVAGCDVVKLIDFGIAKHETASSLTVPGAVFGTPHYMAPEQASGRDQVGPHTDLYSVGIILYELVTGEMPFDGADAMQVMLAQIGMPPPSVRDRRPDCPPELEAIIMRCLAKRPADRFPSAASLREALDRAAGDAPTVAERCAIGEEISGLRLRPTVGDVPDVVREPGAAGELDGSLQTSRPTPTEPTPWVGPPPDPSATRGKWLLVVAVALCVGLTLFVAHVL
ncbi:MAG TPA: serine/threonine protein kinase, partial [Polyangiaceae bacterium]|nr:serine/threonine protein kinase [Polyangiaceae bacterium]